MAGSPSTQKMSLIAIGIAGQGRVARRPPGRRVIGVGAPEVGAEVVVGPGVGVVPLGSREPPLIDLGEGLGDAEIDRLAHAWGEGTRKESAVGSGALARARSRSRLGATSSARRTFSSAITCVVGGTSSRSSSAIASTCSRIAVELGRHALVLLVGEAAAGRAGRRAGPGRDRSSRRIVGAATPARYRASTTAARRRPSQTCRSRPSITTAAEAACSAVIARRGCRGGGGGGGALPPSRCPYRPPPLFCRRSA